MQISNAVHYFLKCECCLLLTMQRAHCLLSTFAFCFAASGHERTVIHTCRAKAADEQKRPSHVHDLLSRNVYNSKTFSGMRTSQGEHIWTTSRRTDYITLPCECIKAMFAPVRAVLYNAKFVPFLRCTCAVFIVLALLLQLKGVHVVSFPFGDPIPNSGSR